MMPIRKKERLSGCGRNYHKPRFASSSLCLKTVHPSSVAPLRTEAPCREHESSFVGARPSSAAPVEQNHLDRLKQNSIKELPVNVVLFDGGGRGRTRSDRRAFVCSAMCFCSTDQPRTDTLRQKSYVRLLRGQCVFALLEPFDEHYVALETI